MPVLYKDLQDKLLAWLAAHSPAMAEILSVSEKISLENNGVIQRIKNFFFGANDS